MHDTSASGNGANLDYARVGHLPGRCASCGFDMQTQGHRTGCTAPPRPPDQYTAPKTQPPNESIRKARTAALALPKPTTRRAQINTYWQTGGPLPPLSKTDDFIDTCKAVDAAIALILQGVPPSLFDWTDPPTDKSLRLNMTARSRWDAIRPPERQVNR